ncbi:MAG TPA: hypothetical protein VIY66_10350, partial [Candidatus Acidoferrales bacterium]
MRTLPTYHRALSTVNFARSGISPQFLKVLGDQRSLIRISYIYDDEGRVAEKHERTGFAREKITKIIYNDRGDKMQ